VQSAHQLRERPSDLDACRASADDHDVRGGIPLVRYGLRALQQTTQVTAESLGVGNRVERERVLGRARYAEEVRSGTRRHDQVRSAHGAAVGQSQDPFGQVDTADLRRQDLDGRVLPEDRAVRAGDVLRRQL
jgi:hypothetical protein